MDLFIELPKKILEIEQQVCTIRIKAEYIESLLSSLLLQDIKEAAELAVNNARSACLELQDKMYDFRQYERSLHSSSMINLKKNFEKLNTICDFLDMIEIELDETKDMLLGACWEQPKISDEIFEPCLSREMMIQKSIFEVSLYNALIPHLARLNTHFWRYVQNEHKAAYYSSLLNKMHTLTENFDKQLLLSPKIRKNLSKTLDAIYSRFSEAPGVQGLINYIRCSATRNRIIINPNMEVSVCIPNKDKHILAEILSDFRRIGVKIEFKELYYFNSLNLFSNLEYLCSLYRENVVNLFEATLEDSSTLRIAEHSLSKTLLEGLKKCIDELEHENSPTHPYRRKKFTSTIKRGA